MTKSKQEHWRLRRSTKRRLKYGVLILASLLIVSYIIGSHNEHITDTKYSQPAKSYSIAMGQEFVDQPISKSQEQLKSIKAVGFTNVRFVVSWYAIQPQAKTKFNWTKYDQIFNAVSQAGLHPLAVIMYTPAWARSPECKNSAYCKPVSPVDFGNFTRAVAVRYEAKGLHQYEIWNEENVKKFWQPTPSASEYMPFLKAAYTSIKAQDKAAVVVSGGMSGVSVEAPGYIEPRTFLAGLYEAGVKDYSDAIGYHAYTFPESPTNQNEKNAWAKINSVPNSLRSIMIKNGDAAKKVWITEYGAPTNGKGDGSTGPTYARTIHTDHVSEAYQAQIAREAANLYQQSDWIQAFYWYTWQDKSNKTNDNENFYGLTDYQQRHKPALDVFKRSDPNQN